jgi:multidrug resistance efflux pump
MFWVSGLRLFGRGSFTGPTWTVKREKLKVTIVARGNLESAKNGDIVCTVRSGQKGSTIASTIKWVIDAGTEVKKGDKLIELDSSGFHEQLKTYKIDVDNARAELVKAEEDVRIQVSDNESDIEQKKNAQELARIDLKKYLEGDFVQSLKDVDGRIKTAQSDLEDWKDRSAWSARMAKKGLMSKVQADADASRRDASEIALDKVQEERRVLVDFTKKRTIQDLTTKVEEAQRALAKASIQARAKLAQVEAAQLSKRSVFEQKLNLQHETEGEIAKCVFLAPQDGLVVYYVPEQVRGGGGSQQSIIAQGEPVREGQKMMQIPDLTQMVVNVRVPEALVSKLGNEEDASDQTTWQKAQVKVDAFSSRILRGHIKTVDTVASQQDWFASDVKVYKTMVAIDEQLDGLKPGMSAEVTINADETPTPVLVVPIQSVVGTISDGAKRHCFVLDADGQPQFRDIECGMSNESLVEIKSGLKQGELVVQNPTPLLNEDSDLKAGRVRPKHEEEEQGLGGDGGKKKKGAKKKNNGAPPSLNPSPSVAPPKAVAGQFDGAAPSEAQKQAFMQKMRTATPAERREMINQAPEAFRERLRQVLREQHLEVAN